MAISDVLVESFRTIELHCRDPVADTHGRGILRHLVLPLGFVLKC